MQPQQPTQPGAGQPLNEAPAVQPAQPIAPVAPTPQVPPQPVQPQGNWPQQTAAQPTQPAGLPPQSPAPSQPQNNWPQQPSAPQPGQPVFQAPQMNASIPGQPTPPMQPKPKNKTLSLAATIIVFAMSAFFVFWTFHVIGVRNKNMDKLFWVKAEKARAKFGPDVQDRPDGKLDLSNRVDGSLSQKEQNIQARVGQQINLANASSFMITKVEKNWKPSGRFPREPKEGSYFIKLSGVIGSRESREREKSHFYISLCATVDAAGKKNDKANVYMSSEDLGEENNLNDATDIAGGEQVSGATVIEVKNGTVPKFVCEIKGTEYAKPTGDKLTTDFKEVYMKAEVNLE